MNKYLIIISILIIALGLKLGLQKTWLSSESKPHLLENVATKTPEQHLLLGKKIDINNATSKYLQVLPGIGPKISERIIEFRKRKGGFSSIDGLKRVRGIGPKKLAKIGPWVKVVSEY